MDILQLLIELDDRGFHELITDGTDIYHFSDAKIPKDLRPHLKTHRETLAGMLSRLPRCYCPDCRGAVVKGRKIVFREN